MRFESKRPLGHIVTELTLLAEQLDAGAVASHSDADLVKEAARTLAALAAPDGESWQHKCEETERALLYWKAKASRLSKVIDQLEVVTLEDVRMLHMVAKYMQHNESPRCSGDLTELALKLSRLIR